MTETPPVLTYPAAAKYLKSLGVECGHCGSNEANATFEHVYPKSGKGTDHENNIVIACLDCNQAMGDAPTMHAKIKKMNLIKKSWEKSTKRRKRRMWLVVR